MSMSIGGASVVVVEHKHGGMSCDAFKGKLEAVLQMIDRGDLGGGLGYGCDEHKAALHIVERQIAETRRCIAEQEANDTANGMAPSQAPTRPNGGVAPCDDAQIVANVATTLERAGETPEDAQRMARAGVAAMRADSVKGWQAPTDVDGEKVTPECLVAWLDAKYARHHEEEDKWAADFIRAHGTK